MEKKLKYPELELGNYEAQTEAEIAEARRQAELQEKRAKRDRDMAILGDIANLVSKGAAMHGGAWKMNKDESMAAQGNAKLRALQESNSKQLAEYAKMRMNAADADRKERNAQKVAEYNAEVEQYKRDLEAEKYAKEQERKDRQEARQTTESIAKINYYNNGGRRTTGGGNTGKAKNMRYLNGWGFDFDDDRAVVEAYSKMVLADPSKVITEEVVTNRGAKEKKAVSNPSVNQMRRALVEGGITKSAGIQWDDENDENNEIDEDFR